MLRVALTGGIATGKSYVLDQFRRRGIPCLDADTLARGVTAPGTEAAAAIAGQFGPRVIAPDGTINRKALSGIVFSDAAERRVLEAIVHPAVYRAILAGLRAFELTDNPPLAIVDVPLLYETGHEREFARVIVAICPVEIQIERLVTRGLSREEAMRRISAQTPTEDKAARADYVIRTDRGFAETDRQVEEVLNNLRM